MSTEASNNYAKYTPGPWECRKIRGYRITTSAYRGTFVDPYVCTVDGIDGKNEANARLIAAAPDMLEAMEGCLVDMQIWYSKHRDPGNKNFEAFKAAIKKAKGE